MNILYAICPEIYLKSTTKYQWFNIYTFSILMHILFCFQPCICYHFSHIYIFDILVCEFIKCVHFAPSSSFWLRQIFHWKLIIWYFRQLYLKNDFLSLFFISNWGFIFFVAMFSKLIIWYFRQLEAFQYDGIHTQYIKTAYNSIFHNFNNFEGSYLRQQNTTFLIWHCNWYEQSYQ